MRGGRVATWMAVGEVSFRSELVTAQLRQRVERICQDLIQTYMDLLIVLLAERGVSVEEQASRVDQLVRALGQLQIDASLFVQGRRVPMVVEQDAQQRWCIRLNAELLERVEDEELLFAFGKPIATMLELPSVSIGLVLQGHDEKQLRNLYHAAKSRVDAPTIASTSVLAIIEHRVRLFASRLKHLVVQLSRGHEVALKEEALLVEHLQAQSSWPDWDTVGASAFMRETISAVEAALGQDKSTRHPPASTLLELCWESLDLSAQSFMRHVGRALRTQGMDVSRALLEAIARIVEPHGVEALEDVSRWPSMQELDQAWRALYMAELETLGRHYQGSAQVKTISAFARVCDAMSLREPAELPFDYPLVCWSVREVSALRDLLQGFVQAHRALKPAHDDDQELLLVDVAAQVEPMQIDGARVSVELQVIGTTIEVLDGYEQLQRLAWEANRARLHAQFMAQPEDRQLSILKRLRGAYEGFFMQTKPVWERRLQGWELDEPLVALDRLAFGVEDVLKVPAYFDPFEAPDQDQMRMVPHFCFVVAMNEHIERVPFKVPIISLISTAATGSPPLIVRLVKVNASNPQRCAWMCDRELTMMTMQGHPVQLTLRAVEGNMVRMLAYE